MNAFSSGGENGTGMSGAARRIDRSVEVLERLLGDGRGDLRAEAAGARVLVQDEHLRAAPHALEHALLVPRDERSQVEHLDLEALLRELVRGLGRRVHHRAPGDDDRVVAGPVDVGVAERDRVPLLRHLALDAAVQVLVLEEEDGVRILDRATREGPSRRAASPGTRS